MSGIFDSVQALQGMERMKKRNVAPNACFSGILMRFGRDIGVFRDSFREPRWGLVGNDGRMENLGKERGIPCPGFSILFGFTGNRKNGEAKCSSEACFFRKLGEKWLSFRGILEIFGRIPDEEVWLEMIEGWRICARREEFHAWNFRFC